LEGRPRFPLRGRIAEDWGVFDMLGILQRGAIPA
jgi:hypothetical protein